MLNDNIEEYIKTIESNLKDKECITHRDLLTNCILTSKRLIVEIESLEDKILKNPKNQNICLVVGAKLEFLIREIKNITNNYFDL